MNELVKAVLVLVLSAAAAVWLLGVALQLWPDTCQLAYGNHLPYLKVEFDRPANAVRFWVEDFGGLPYERVWLYVNGRLAASGGPGAEAAAKCGDEVAAVVKYHSGTKKLEGRILCTQPIKAPGGGETKRVIRLTQVTQAYRAMTGDMDQTSPPLRFDGSCDVEHHRASVTITALRPDVIFCVGVHCGTSYTFSWTLPPPGPYTFPSIVREIVPIHVFKAPDAPASQLLGGGRGVIDIYVEYSYNRNVGAYNLEVYVNGTRVAHCRMETTVSRELRSWTEYKEPNATAIYLIRFVGERDGKPVVLDGNIVLYEREDSTFGYRLIVNPVEDPTPADLHATSPHRNLTITSPSGAVYRGAVSVPFILEEMPKTYLHNDVVEVYMGPFFRFLNQLSSDPQQRSLFEQALDRMVDIEFNMPYIAVNRSGEYLVYHIHTSRRGGAAVLGFKALSISSLGAVYANAVLPIDVRLPPPVLPPRNATRTYIFGYR